MSKQMSDYLFMSYRKAEEDIALRVARDLRERQINVWMDQLNGLSVGDNWVKGLQDAIDNASGMLIMLSPAYHESKFCMRELSRADANGYPLFPLLIEDVPLKTSSFILQETQYIKFVDWQNESVYTQKLDDLVQAITAKVASVANQTITNMDEGLQNGIYNARALEDELEDASDRIQKVPESSIVVKMKRTRLTTQIAQHIDEYKSVLEQIEVENNPRTQVRLGKMIGQIESALEDLETELNALPNE